MDKKNLLIGIALLILAFYLMNVQSEERQLENEKRAEAEANASRLSENEGQAEDEANASGKGKEAVGNASASGETNASKNNPSKGSTIAPPASQEEIITKGLYLGEHDPIEIFFTNHGGAIREIRLKKTERVLKEYAFQYPKDTPALAISFDDQKKQSIELEGYEESAFELIDGGNPSHVTWINRTGKVEIRREYWRVAGDDPYLIHHRTTVTNHADAPLVLERVRLQVGTALPIDQLYNFFPMPGINIGYYNADTVKEMAYEGCYCAYCSGRINGAEDEFWQINELESEFGREEIKRFHDFQAKWVCVNNRFFANVIRPVKEHQDSEVKAEIIDLRNYPEFKNKYQDKGRDYEGISGSFAFPFGSIEPGDSQKLEVVYYAGPKDYTRLEALGHEQKTVMQFGIFWWVSEPLNAFLNFLQGWLGNFGLAIIVMTICVKLVLWPLTAKSIRSQKKMKELQEPMQALKEKYKGNPQKLNQEMMKFYKEQGVNPLAGCWPMLIQMPIFLGLFWMLRSAAELRGAEFLWIDDLSEQDNLAFLGSFSLNLLPLFMVVTQVFQMKLTPMNLGPGASEQQRIQAKMMRMMPYFFLLFLYFFSSALVLYWTVQNILSIIQTLVTKRGDPPVAPTIATEEAADKTKKLVSPQHMSPEEREHRRALGLRLRGEVTKKEIKVAFKKRVSKYHPDKIRNLRPKRQREAEAKRQKLEEAYEFLLKKG